MTHDRKREEKPGAFEAKIRGHLRAEGFAALFFRELFGITLATDRSFAGEYDVPEKVFTKNGTSKNGGELVIPVVRRFVCSNLRALVPDRSALTQSNQPQAFSWL